MRPNNQTRINEHIRASELRVIGAEGENVGVISKQEAISKAREAGLDLIEISPNANPPVAKIMDFGKYQYELNKKQKAIRAKSKEVEVKSIQIKVGTGDNDLQLKAKKTSEWLNEGNRVKIELFLPGRTKYMDKEFLKSRLERMFKFITVGYKIAEEAKKGPKGLSTIIEKA